MKRIERRILNKANILSITATVYIGNVYIGVFEKDLPLLMWYLIDRSERIVVNMNNKPIVI